MEKYESDNSGYLTYRIAMIDLADGTQVEYYYDVNDDGEFDIRDLVRMKKMLGDTENEEQHSGRDITGDEILDSLDLTDVRKKFLY